MKYSVYVAPPKPVSDDSPPGAPAGKARSFTDLYQAMVALYPSRVNRGVLWNSARSFMS